MLLCDRTGLLSSWEPRVGYSQNVMDILSSYTKQVSRKIKTKKGTVWNVEKIEPNHVEVKSIGGDVYHPNDIRSYSWFQRVCTESGIKITTL